MIFASAFIFHFVAGYGTWYRSRNAITSRK